MSEAKKHSNENYTIPVYDAWGNVESRAFDRDKAVAYIETLERKIEELREKADKYDRFMDGRIYPKSWFEMYDAERQRAEKAEAQVQFLKDELEQAKITNYESLWLAEKGQHKIYKDKLAEAEARAQELQDTKDELDRRWSEGKKENLELKAQLERVKALPQKWKEAGGYYREYMARVHCTGELEAALGEKEEKQ